VKLQLGHLTFIVAISCRDLVSGKTSPVLKHLPKHDDVVSLFIRKHFRQDAQIKLPQQEAWHASRQTKLHREHRSFIAAAVSTNKVGFQPPDVSTPTQAFSFSESINSKEKGTISDGLCCIKVQIIRLTQQVGIVVRVRTWLKTSTCKIANMLADESEQTERFGSTEQLAEKADQSGGSTEQVGEQAERAKEAELPSGSEASVPRTVPTIPTYTFRFPLRWSGLVF
jgi:hypothetical protein